MTGPVTASASARHILTARRGLRAGLAIRGTLALVGAMTLLVAGVFVARSGIKDHLFPPFIQGDANTVITSYSGPSITIAVTMGAVAGLLLVSAVTDLWRRHVIGADLAD